MKDLTVNLLRKHERDQAHDEIAVQKRLLDHPKIEDKVQVKKNIAILESKLSRLSPEPLAPAEKDKLAKLEKQLAAKIQEGMPTDEMMRKNPVGAIDRHTTWERAKKKLIKMWKNARIQLNPDSDDRDLANVERLRSPGQVDRLRTDAQISGHMSYSNIPEELWPFEQPKETALEQAKRAEQERIARSVLEAEQAVAGVAVPSPQAIAAKLRKPMSEDNKQAARDRLARARESKRIKALAARHGEVDVQVDMQAPIVTADDQVSTEAVSV
jgi:hypothetical protein